MSEKIKDRIFNALIISFLILYLCVGFISCWHCIEFCMVGNPLILSVMMSFAFEVGLALTLFSVLITEENKNNIVSWILMTILTCVQVMGNIFSVEKYMELSNNNFYIYIQNGFLHWFTDDMPQSDIMSIIAIILGALLPIVALLMTSMVARNWKNRMNEKKSESIEKQEKEEQVFGSKPMFDIEEQEHDKNAEQMFRKNESSSIDEHKENTEQPIEDESPSETPETAPEEVKKNQLDNLISEAKKLAEERNNEIMDGSLLTPEQSEEAKRAISQAPRQTPISLFNRI